MQNKKKKEKDTKNSKLSTNGSYQPLSQWQLRCQKMKTRQINHTM